MTEAMILTCLKCGQRNRVQQTRLIAGPKCATCAERLAGGTVTSIDMPVHDKATRHDGLPLVVDYWAPWCGPCRMMAPEFAKAAATLEHKVRCAKINTEDFPAVSQRLNIRGIPLLIMWAKGREVARLSGARPASEISAFVRQHL